MSDLASSGAVFDIVIAVLLLEALVLVAASLMGRRWLRELGGFVAAGLGLAVAGRAALAGADWKLVAGGLTVALIAHGYDISRRLRAGAPGGGSDGRSTAAR